MLGEEIGNQEDKSVEVKSPEECVFVESDDHATSPQCAELIRSDKQGDAAEEFTDEKDELISNCRFFVFCLLGLLIIFR